MSDERKMKIVIADGELRIDLCELMREHVTKEELNRICEFLAIEDGIIEAVVDFLCDGITKEYGCWSIPSGVLTRLDKHRLRLMEKFDELRYQTVLALVRQIEQIDADRARIDKWAWNLYHSLPVGANRPPLPDYVHAMSRPDKRRCEDILGLIKEKESEARP